MALIRELAQMARMVYFGKDQKVDAWTRMHDSEDFSGFHAAEFHRANGNSVDVAICFRGTQFFNAEYTGNRTTVGSVFNFALDAVADLQLYNDFSPQVKAARIYAMAVIARTVKAHRPVNLILTGHSLGASLAQSAVAVCPTDTRVITFCTPLVSFGTLLLATLRDYNKVLNITVKGDAVTRFGCIGSRMAIGHMKQLSVAYEDKHSMHNLADYLAGDSKLGGTDVTAPSFDPAAT